MADDWTQPVRDFFGKVKSSRAGRVTKYVVNKPISVGEGEGIFGGGVSRFFAGFLKWILGIGIILSFILLVIFLIMSYRTSVVGTISKEGVVAIEETGAPLTKFGISEIWDFIMTGGGSFKNDFTWESEVIKNEYNEDLGVKIKSFQKTNPVYFDYDPIQIVGEIEASSLKDETVLGYSCELEGYDGNVRVVPKDYRIYKDTGKEITTVNCFFDNGFKASKNEESRTATLKVDYDFVSKAVLKVYFLKDEVLTQLQKDGRDPFEKIDDPAIMEGRITTTRSRVTDGPVMIGIGISQSQPLSEKIDNGHLGITLSRKSIWSGSLNKVNSLELQVPPVIELIEDINYCDFEYVGESYDQPGFRVYKVTKRALDNKVNVDCADKNSVGRSNGLTEDECNRRFKYDISLGCNFKVTDLPYDGVMFYTNLYVEADYSYEDEKKEVVTVFQRGGLGEDACKDLDLNDCLSANRCRPIYGVDNNYIGCSACPQEWRYCSDYGNSELLCTQDPCEVGPCLVENGICKSNT